MFDIGATELLIVIIVAVVVIGPKDMPLALRTAGRWIGKARRVTGHFRAGIDAMVREAEMEDMEKEWKRRNAEIMAHHPDAAKDPGSEAPLDNADNHMEPLPLPDAPYAAQPGAKKRPPPAPTES